MKEKVHFKIALYFKQLSEEFTEYGPIIERIRLVKDNRKDTTMWVNPHCEMGYNEDFCFKLTNTELKAVVLHEIRHIEYGHFTREASIRRVYGNMYTHEVHNVAMDLEINSKISGLPETGCFPENYKYPKDLSYEEYFVKLINDPEMQNKTRKIFIKGGGHGPNDTDMDHMNGAEGVRNTSSSTENLSDEDEAFLRDLLDEVHEAKQERGSGQGNQKSKLTLKPSKPIDIVNYIKTRCSNIRNDKTFGYDNIDYNMLRSSTIPDIVDFKTYNIVVPVIISFIIDVSGSRSDKQVNDSISKIWSTLESVDDITFVMDLFFADDGVTQVNRVTNRSEIPTSFTGRGGTYLSKAYKKFEIEYDLVVVLTDGFIDWDDINKLEKKFYDKTVIGIDKESYITTHNNTKLPTFVL